MQAYGFELQRRRVAKILLGFSAIAFTLRVVMGITNEPTMYGVSIYGYEQFVYVTLAATAVLLLWDIRDKVVDR